MIAFGKLRKKMLRLLGGGVCALVLAGNALAQDRGQASVFIYHRFGEMAFPTTSVSIAQLEAHIAELKSGPYQVMPLEKIIDTMAAGQPLPDHTVAITMDDGFASVYSQAWPRLRAAGLPFTLFISTDAIDERLRAHLSWDQIREMLAGGGVSIGHHSGAHQHMPKISQAANAADLARATQRFKDELGLQPVLFAYPYGEYSKRERAQIAGMGFKAAFGQHSGVVHSGSDRFSLPRFAMNVQFASKQRFALAANALALPALDIVPDDSMLGPQNNPPLFGFTVPATLSGLEGLSCYASNQTAAVPVHQLGENRIEVRMAAPFPPGRGRINCTLPDSSGRWRWLGQAFVIP